MKYLCISTKRDSNMPTPGCSAGIIHEITYLKHTKVGDTFFICRRGTDVQLAVTAQAIFPSTVDGVPGYSIAYSDVRPVQGIVPSCYLGSQSYIIL